LEDLGALRNCLIILRNDAFLMNDCQFGFRSNRSTSMAVLEMTEKISDAWNKNNSQLG